MLLTEKCAAALIGVAPQTLRQSRCNTPSGARHDLYFPKHVAVPPHTGTRAHVAYDLAEVQAWAKQMRRELHWEELPLRLVLPAAEAVGLPLPAALAARVATVPLPPLVRAR